MLRGSDGSGSLVKLALALTMLVRCLGSIRPGRPFPSSCTCGSVFITPSSCISVRRLRRVRIAPNPGSVNLRTCPTDLEFCGPGGPSPWRASSRWYTASAVLELAADSDTCPHLSYRIEVWNSIHAIHRIKQHVHGYELFLGLGHSSLRWQAGLLTLIVSV